MANRKSTSRRHGRVLGVGPIPMGSRSQREDISRPCPKCGAGVQEKCFVMSGVQRQTKRDKTYEYGERYRKPMKYTHPERRLPR